VWSVVWALSPALLALPAAPAFAWASWRLRSRGLAIAAAGYLLATIVFYVLAGQPHSSTAYHLSGGFGIVLMVGATVHAFVIRKRVFGPSGICRNRAVPAGTMAPPVTAPADSWPVLSCAERPLASVAGERPSVECTRFDRHRLGLQPQTALWLAVAGAGLITLDVVLSLNGAGIGPGAGLLLAAALGPLFGRSLDGPTLAYRIWGVPHVLRLDAVTEISSPETKRAPTTVKLTAPGLGKPVSVAVAGQYGRAPAAREHLRSWLDRPGVQVTSTAATVLRTGASRPPVPLTRARRAFVLLSLLIGPLVVVGAGGWELSGAPAHFAHAAGSTRIQAAPTQLARVQSLHVSDVDARGCTCHTSAYRVRLLSTGAPSVVHARGLWTPRPGQLVEVKVDPEHPKDAEFPGAPYYTHSGAIRQLVLGLLALAAGLLFGAVVTVPYRRTTRAAAQSGSP
jgi:hypothetical protein